MLAGTADQAKAAAILGSDIAEETAETAPAA